MFFGNLGHSEQETPAHIEDFSSEYIGNNENPLYVSPDAVAAHVWQQLVEETQRDLTERGVVVGMRSGQFITSGVFLGEGEGYALNDPERKRGGAFKPPPFPYGILNAFSGIRDLVVVHSHPMPEQLDHLRTTMFTYPDICKFLPSGYRGLVMVDRGGSHLLARTHKAFNFGGFFRKNVVHEALQSVRNQGGEVLDIMKLVARELYKVGLAYYYTPELSPDPAGYVKFWEVNDRLVLP